MRRPSADYPDLFPNAKELEADWYKHTGIYPMHGTIVVKDTVLKEHPWVARSLFNAYAAAKDAWLRELTKGAAQSASDKEYRELTSSSVRTRSRLASPPTARPSRRSRATPSSSA